MGETSIQGQVQVYTGEGKGKTTCALGAGIRAAGHGLRVLMICFMKAKVAWRGDGSDVNYGEFRSIGRIPNFEIIPVGRQSWVDKENPDPVDIEMAQNGLEMAIDAIKENACDVLILDEINVAVEWSLIGLEQQLELINMKPNNMEIIMTGRYAAKEVIEAADLVTEMTEVKHYYVEKKLKARKGFEY